MHHQKPKDPYYEPPLSQCPEPIAVVGMGCRLPGDVRSPADFWELIINNRSGRTPRVPKERFNIDAYLNENPDRPGSLNVPGGYFLSEDIREFDPAFFGISPLEATWMDPQQRKLLEVVYECLESAGTTLQDISGTRTGCYVATFTADHQQLSTKEPDFRHNYAAIGVDPGIISARIAHFLNINGPAFIANTACSSSLYALQAACSALTLGEVQGAIVGGSNLMLTIDQQLNTAKLGVLSPTSECHTFDASADGYGRAEGIGALYLKRLSDALRDGDNVRAVIRATATNTNGKHLGVGITHPSKTGQERVIRDAHQRGGNLNPLLCGFFECHGTGTPIGDPIEVEALSRAMNDDRTADCPPLLIGAVKPNIGHSEAASGIAAIIKAVMMVEKGLIPPVYGFKTPNPKIDFQGLKVQVVSEAVPWPVHLPVRRVCVNSFGYGGTNGHTIIESLESVLPGLPGRIPRFLPDAGSSVFSTQKFLLPFSAHDRPTLLRNIAQQRKYMKESNESIRDLAHTLVAGRSLLDYRGFSVAAEAELDGELDVDKIATGDARDGSPRLGFVFTGQGAQWPRMGAELFEAFPIFQSTIAHLDSVLKTSDPSLEWTIKDSLLASAEDSQIHRVELSQPLCTAVQIGIVNLLNSCDIHPTATVGHSSGEIAAGYAAQVLTAEEAILIAYYRGKTVAGKLRQGAMMAVGLGSTEARQYLVGCNGKVVVACENSPESVTMSGDVDAIEAIAVVLQEKGIFHRVLKTGGLAYHSPHMLDYARAYGNSLEALNHKIFRSSVPHSAQMVSSVTGNIQTKENLQNTYWVRNLTQPVRFETALGRLLDSTKVNTLLEIGPHSALAGPIRQILTIRPQSPAVKYVSTLIRGKDSSRELLKAAGNLFLLNYPVNFSKINKMPEGVGTMVDRVEPPRLLVDLPYYQWNYTKLHWSENRAGADSRALTHARHDLLGSKILGGVRAEPTWRNILRLKDLPWLSGHTLGSDNVLAASAYIAMAIEAAMQLNEISAEPVTPSNFTLRNVTIQKALVIPDDETGIEVLLSSKIQDGWLHYKICSVAQGVWAEHSTGQIAINGSSSVPTPRQPLQELTQSSAGKRWYQAFEDIGFKYSGPFVGIGTVKSTYKATEAVAETVIQRSVTSGESRYVLHPASMDMCLQVLLVSISQGQVLDLTGGFVPIGADQIVVKYTDMPQAHKAIGKTYSHVLEEGLRTRISTLQLTDENGETLIDMQGLHHIEFEGAMSSGELAAQEGKENFWKALWKPDVALAHSTELACHLKSTAARKQFDALVDLYLFKYPQASILEIFTAADQPSLRQKHPEHAYFAVDRLVTPIDTASLPDDRTYDLLIITDQAVLPGETLPKIVPYLKLTASVILPYASTPLNFCGVTQRLEVEGVARIFTLGEDESSSGSETSSSEAESYIDGLQAINLVYCDVKSSLVTALDLDAASSPGFPEFRISSLKEFSKKRTVEDHTIFLDTGKSVLGDTNLDQETFHMIQKLLNARSVLWVTNGGLHHGARPEFGLANGMARSVRSENASLALTTLDVDLEAESTEVVSKAILDVFFRANKTDDDEFILKDGMIHTNRLQPVEKPEASYTLSDKRFGTPTGSRVGLKTRFTFAEDLNPDQTPGAAEVEVEVKAVGINPELYSNADEKIFSISFSGVVSRLGEGVTDFTVGDSVMGLTPSGGSQYHIAPTKFLQRIEATSVIEFENAASFPQSYVSAVQVLQLASPEDNDQTLILPSARLVGKAILHLLTERDQTAFVMAADSNDVEFFSRYKIPKERVLLPEALKSDHGFNVVVAGEDDDNLAELWRGIADFGRLVAIRTQSSSGNKMPPSLDTWSFRRNARFAVYNLHAQMQGNKLAVGRALREAADFRRTAAVAIIEPSLGYDLASIPEIQPSKNASWGANSVVSYMSGADSLKLESKLSQKIFSPDAYYLLVGCLGGLGRSLAAWMIDCGARNLIFMGRTGADKPEAASLIANLQKRGANIHIARGDVALKSDVQKIADLNLPIRGIVQAAMVLDDRLFADLDATSFTTATTPKVLGTQNLHSVFLDTPLDFFIMTSSISATLGTQGQSNYSAANSFLDFMALHRHSLGLPATSLILPMILGVGYIAEHPEIEEGLNRKGLYGIEEAELLDAFRKAILYDGHQLVIGMNPQRLAKALGRKHTTDPFWFEAPRLAHIRSSVISSRGNKAAGNVGRVVFEDHKGVVGYIIEKLGRLLMREAEEIEERHSVSFYGLDSMIGTEFRNWCYKEFGLEMGLQALVATATSIGDIAERACEVLGIPGRGE